MAWGPICGQFSSVNWSAELEEVVLLVFNPVIGVTLL